MQFKYRDLKAVLDTMTEDELNQDVTVEISDEEFVAVNFCDVIEYTDILDAGHIFLSTLPPEKFGNRD